MQNLMNDLIKLFAKDDRIFADGKLLKNKLTELALKLDQSLIELLLSDKRAKKNFFIEQSVKKDTVLVFDKDKFISFVNNKEFLPNSFTSFKNKIGLMTNGDYLKEKSDVVLAWAYKDCVLEGGQDKEDQKRDEIFYNETLAPDEIDRLFEPKVLTNFKKYDVKGEHKVTDFTGDDNLIIKGNNLVALHCLKKKYRGQVKLIYIDPPFNRDADSFYNDKFRHSTWLTFIKNRLEVARELLESTGILCVHIDDVESSYLKILIDEVFGKDKFINTICVRDSHPSGLKLTHKDKTIIKTKSYVHLYAKNTPCDLNPLYQKRYEWDTHFNAYIDTDKKPLVKHNLSEYILKNKIVDKNFKLDEKSLLNDGFREFAFKNRNKIFQSTKEIPAKAKQESKKHKDKVIEYTGSDGSREFAFNERRLSPLSKSIWNIGFDGYYKEDFAKLLCDFWDDVDFNNSQNEGGVSLPNGKKPEFLLARLISLTTAKKDIVLDFHLGSGTTCAVAHKMQRRYVGIEQLNYGDNNNVVRLKNVINGDKSGISKSLNWQGGGSFIYAELMEWNEKYMQDIKDADTPRKLLNIYEKMKQEAFFRYDIEFTKFDEKEFAKLPLKEQKQVLCECLDKNHLYVNLSEIDDATYKVSADDKKLNKEIYKQSI